MALPCQNYDLLFVLWIFKQNLVLSIQINDSNVFAWIKKKEEPFCTMHVLVTFL